MNWKKICLCTVLLLVASMSGAAQSRKHHVLFALVSPNESDWSMTTVNIRNLIAGLSPDETDVELVAYGPGISFLGNGSSATADIKALAAKHVRFVACQNAMRMKHMTAADLIPGVEMVPSGLVEVVKKQEQGWSYIKAGQ
jgi:intracellular sulfur oxidation DsrE/DsrF family protein